MPKKNKAAKNTKSNTSGIVEKRELIEADLDGQVYGIIERVLGGCYFDVNCLDAKKRRCKVRNKRLKLQVRDCVIVALREFEEKTGDIIYKYNSDEVRELQKKGVICNLEVSDCTANNNESDDEAFIFENI